MYLNTPEPPFFSFLPASQHHYFDRLEGRNRRLCEKVDGLFQYSGILSENLLLLLKKDENIVTSSSFINPMKVHFVEKYKNRVK